jgi:hypothetical protein
MSVYRRGRRNNRKCERDFAGVVFVISLPEGLLHRDIRLKVLLTLLAISHKI